MGELGRKWAYYNENDQKTAAWLRELIKGKLIADGEVDTRSIVDVQPADLGGFIQCHFFAGIGGWSYALRLAGWSDDRAVWTGSCPCQPFSSAGAQVGGDDPRHLWPAWFRLIRECRPVVVFGEQVESAIAHGWLDLVCDGLEGEGYAAGAVGVPAAGVGAFHIRQRVWFVADANHARSQGRLGAVVRERPDQCVARPCRASNELAQPDDWRCEEPNIHLRPARPDAPTVVKRWAGYWSAADWIPCADGKARPIEPGLEPVADGVPARVGRLRGYGNAIVPQVAAEVIAAYMEIRA